MRGRGHSASLFCTKKPAASPAKRVAAEEEKRQDSPAAAGECYCTRLFQLEQALVELTPEERYTKRLELETPVLDALLAWANALKTQTAPKSALGKTLHYLLEQ